MKKLLLSIAFTLMTLMSFACHESYVTLVSGPTAIGGGQYSTTVQVCIGQTVNWGGTFDFTMTLTGANFVSYSPATLSNTYNAYTTASCGGPNCFMGGCASVSANANSTSTANVVTYTTSSSTPAGYPLVPDDVEQCGGNPTSYCFNFTFLSDAYPTSISLGGNTELTRVTICQSVCGHPATYTSPCNGSYDPAMTLTFTALPIELLYFNATEDDGYNLLEWASATEINNDYYTIERSFDGKNWEVLANVDGAGNSVQALNYRYMHYNPEDSLNYYRLKQTDFDGAYEYFDIKTVDNRLKNPPTVTGVFNLMGQEFEIVPGQLTPVFVNKSDETRIGIKIVVYSDNTVKKIVSK
jgi:hypothetical protein